MQCLARRTLGEDAQLLQSMICRFMIHTTFVSVDIFVDCVKCLKIPKYLTSRHICRLELKLI
jgi:hypothetical protein